MQRDGGAGGKGKGMGGSAEKEEGLRNVRMAEKREVGFGSSSGGKG
jgi:hypothetical protein